MTTDNTNTTRNDSLAARTDTGLQSLLVWSPDSGISSKTVALVLMVLDHAIRIPAGPGNGCFWPGVEPFRFCPGGGLNLSRHAHIRQSATTGCGDGVTSPVRILSGRLSPV